MKVFVELVTGAVVTLEFEVSVHPVRETVFGLSSGCYGIDGHTVPP